ncbi:MAG: hypothetical protein IJE45_02965 [Bacilli bacterium]|nr:hypothetical protein [Bacilli bacterium]
MNNYKIILKKLDNEQLKNDVLETTGLFINTLCGDVVSAGQLVNKILETSLNFRDKILMRNFFNYIFAIDKSLDQGVKLLVKLFPNDEKGKKNAEKIVLILDRIDNEEKLKYIANATRSCVYQDVTIEEFFRIIKIIDDSYFYDLVFLSNNITKKSLFKGNITIHALANLGLMMQCGIDCNESIETQNYAFTKLGMLVDKYALSYDNEERQQFYLKEQPEITFKTENIIETASDEDIDDLFEDTK